MENLEVLVRGLAMQSGPGGGGLGLPRSVSFQGLEVLWVLAVATIVLAVVSMTRVSVVTWGWSKSGGHVRVRVQSFSSLAEGALFSAEIVNCSADSCSEDASSAADCVSEGAEMLFIFDQKGASLMATTTTVPSQHASPRLTALEKIPLEFPELQELHKQEEAVTTSPPLPRKLSFPRRQGIEWVASPANALNSLEFTSLFPAWATPVASTTRVVKGNVISDWDPLLKLKIRDAVFSNGSFTRKDITLPLAPVAIPDSTSAATLKDDVVRVWDCESKSLVKSVHLASEGYAAPATAFDVNWERSTAAIAREGGLLSVVNLESGSYQKCFQSEQAAVQAIHLEKTSSPNTFFTGGPLSATPGCSVSIWDRRSSSRELSMKLPAAVTIFGISSDVHELHVRDDPGSVATHDVRMLRGPPMNRRPREVANHGSRDRWWDIEGTFDEETAEDDADDDDDFFDCLSSEDVHSSSSSSSYMSRSFVRAVSFNFSSPQKH